MEIAVAQDSNVVSLQARALGGDFAGGLNENTNRKPNQSPSLLNVYVDDSGILSTRPRGRGILSLAFYGKRAFTYQGTDNVERSAITDNSTIRVTDNMKTFAVIPDTAGTGDLILTAGYECRMTSYHNSLYWTNGFDEVGYWDGGANSTALAWFSAGDRPRHIFTYQDKIWFLNSPTNPNYLRYSELGGTSFVATNEIPIPSDQSGAGTGMARSIKGLVVFLNDSTWLLAGYSAETYNLICINSTIGCVNGDSIQYTKDGNIIFLSKDGLCKTNGLEVVLLQDFVPKTIKSISQVYAWNQYEDALVSTQWEYEMNMAAPWTSTNVFIPNATDNAPPTPFFEYDRIYTDPTGSTTIPDGTFPAGQGDWEGTANFGTLTFNVGSAFFDWDGGGSGYVDLIRYFRQVQVVLYCMDTGEEVVTESAAWNYTPGGIPPGAITDFVDGYVYTYTHDATLLGAKYHGKRFKFIVRVNDREGSTVSEITSPEFFVNTLNAPSQFSFDFVQHHVAATHDTITFSNFSGACYFQNMDYISKTLKTPQKKWANINIDMLDFSDQEDGSKFNNCDVYMGFSADSGATWHDFGGGSPWVKVWDANVGYVIDSSISSYDPNLAGVSNAIRFRATVSSVAKNYPLRFNSIAYSWYNSMTDVPQSNDNISSAMWNGRYLLAYTQAGDAVNEYVLTYDEASGIPRYLKWYFPNGVSLLTTYANSLIYGYNVYPTNACALFRMLSPDDTSGEQLYDTHYFTDEFDMGLPGMQKSFDVLSLLYDKNGQAWDQLKIEVWINGKYNGDLDIYLRKNTPDGEYFSLKHSTLIKHNAIVNLKNVSYMFSADYYMRPVTWVKTEVPFGWGNKIQLRFFWGMPSTPSTPNNLECSYGGEILREFSIEALSFKDVYPEPALNLHEGNL